MLRRSRLLGRLGRPVSAVVKAAPRMPKLTFRLPEIRDPRGVRGLDGLWLALVVAAALAGAWMVFHYVASELSFSDAGHALGLSPHPGRFGVGRLPQVKRGNYRQGAAVLFLELEHPVRRIIGVAPKDREHLAVAFLEAPHEKRLGHRLARGVMQPMQPHQPGAEKATVPHARRSRHRGPCRLPSVAGVRRNPRSCALATTIMPVSAATFDLDQSATRSNLDSVKPNK